MTKILRAALPLALAFVASPAHANAENGWDKTNHRLELTYQILNGLDFATTEYCLRRDTCHEANPLIGGRPGTVKLFAVKAATGAAHYFLARELAKRDPKAARIFQYVSLAVQGGVVAANLRFVF